MRSKPKRPGSRRERIFPPAPWQEFIEIEPKFQFNTLKPAPIQPSGRFGAFSLIRLVQHGVRLHFCFLSSSLRLLYGQTTEGEAKVTLMGMASRIDVIGEVWSVEYFQVFASITRAQIPCHTGKYYSMLITSMWVPTSSLQITSKPAADETSFKVSKNRSTKHTFLRPQRTSKHTHRLQGNFLQCSLLQPLLEQQQNTISYRYRDLPSPQ